MSQELEEKVARAIARADGFELPHDMTLPYAPGSRIGRAVFKARAALAVVREAMAELTPEILNAMVNAGMDARKVYKAAISASPLGTPEGGAK